MAEGLSPGPVWAAIARGNKAAAGAAGVSPEVLKLVPDAVRRMNAEHENVSNHDVEVVTQTATIELVFLPRLALGEKLTRGGATSLGREVHLIYDRGSGKFMRLHFAR